MLISTKSMVKCDLQQSRTCIHQSYVEYFWLGYKLNYTFTLGFLKFYFIKILKNLMWKVARVVSRFLLLQGSNSVKENWQSDIQFLRGKIKVCITLDSFKKVEERGWDGDWMDHFKNSVCFWFYLKIIGYWNLSKQQSCSFIETRCDMPHVTATQWKQILKIIQYMSSKIF